MADRSRSPDSIRTSTANSRPAWPIAASVAAGDTEAIAAGVQNFPRGRSQAMAMSRAMAMSKAMAMPKAMAMSEPMDDFYSSFSHDPSSAVRTDPGWIDYVHLTSFLQDSASWLDAITDELRSRQLAANFDNDIDDLLWKQEHPDRYERMPEIIEESVDYLPRFMHSCGIDPEIHSQTYRLMNSMSLIAYTCVMNFKNALKQLRPSQLSRYIKPAIAVPAHYSFPSGQATQAHLIILTLKHVLAETAFSSKIDEHLEHEAYRVAENREWAGLHFASDSHAGEYIAREIKHRVEETNGDIYSREIDEWS